MLRRAAALVMLAGMLVACGAGRSAAPTASAPRSSTTLPTGATVTASPPGSPRPPILTEPPTTARPPAEPLAPTTAAPATTGAPAKSVTVTAAQNGATVDTARGQDVVVSLSTGELWTEPTSGNDAVLRRTAGSVNSQTGDATATFSAVAAGAARVTSQHRCLPKPGQVCPQYVAVWSVTVVVR